MNKSMLKLLCVFATLTGGILAIPALLPFLMPYVLIALLLFIAPFIIVNVNSILFESIICSIATFAAVQEGHYIRTRN